MGHICELTSLGKGVFPDCCSVSAAKSIRGAFINPVRGLALGCGRTTHLNAQLNSGLHMKNPPQPPIILASAFHSQLKLYGL